MSELGDFLRSRRAALRPADLGLAPGLARRRVPGLRREELALLAGISIDYYARLEQGRIHTVSETVYASMADALRLDEGDRARLRSLARPDGPGRPADAPRRVRPGLLQLLAALRHTPALVLGHRTDILAWNECAQEVLADFAALPAAGRNLARLVFLPHPPTPPVFRDEGTAEEVVGALRAHAARHPEDPLLAGLVGELSCHSAHFTRMWSARNVRRNLSGSRHLGHPDCGPTGYLPETLTLPGEPGRLLLAYIPACDVQQPPAAADVLSPYASGTSTSPAAGPAGEAEDAGADPHIVLGTE
ncbi:helix-turn-helix transcriptional regulator [Streptomyces sp. NPDC102409]|uniref:helix-turn-helix transcriptional regulator n=1 Tax=Streptomyces sp. NPDC102409 TaxID=3366172 RepID=UPI00380A3BA6